MTSLARLLLAVLLLLALPMQGWAAGARLHCGPSQAPALHVHAGHDHAGVPQAPEAADAAVPGRHGACALCCHAPALPAPEWRLSEAPPVPPEAAPSGGPLPPFLTGRPERPPRIRLG